MTITREIIKAENLSSIFFGATKAQIEHLKEIAARKLSPDLDDATEFQEAYTYVAAEMEKDNRAHKDDAFYARFPSPYTFLMSPLHVGSRDQGTTYKIEDPVKDCHLSGGDEQLLLCADAGTIVVQQKFDGSKTKIDLNSILVGEKGTVQGFISDGEKLYLLVDRGLRGGFVDPYSLCSVDLSQSFVLSAASCVKLTELDSLQHVGGLILQGGGLRILGLDSEKELRSVEAK